VDMYVYEEMFQGRKLHDIINETHENKKYLPGIKIPDNVRAVPDIKKVVTGAHVLIFVMPHQFIKPLCQWEQRTWKILISGFCDRLVGACSLATCSSFSVYAFVTVSFPVLLSSSVHSFVDF